MRPMPFRVPALLAALVCALSCCGGPSGSGDGGADAGMWHAAEVAVDASPPKIENLKVEASYNSVRIRFVCDEPCSVRVGVAGSGGDFLFAHDGAAKEHDITVSPLFCFARCDYTIEVADDSGNATSLDGGFITPEYRSAFISYHHIRGSSTSEHPVWLDMLEQEGIKTLEVGLPDLGYIGTFEFQHFIEHDSGVERMAALLELAKERGFETLGVIATFGAPPYDPDHAGLYARDAEGEPMGWLCPANPETKAVVTSLIEAYLDRLELDGIVLDYIRYIDTYCVCDYHMTHSDGEPGTFEWDEWSADDLTSFVEYLHGLFAARGKRLWAYVWSTNQRYHLGFWGSERFVYRGQDWAAWARRNSIDGLKNMDYLHGPMLRLKLMLQESAIVGHGVLWAPAFWFSHQESGVDTPQELEAVISTMRGFHISGYSIFDWTKVVSRPDDFGWAHDALVELNSSPR